MSRQSKSPRSGNEPTLQLSSGQLIIAICLLIVVGAGLIALGIMVGSFEQRMRMTDTAAVDNTSLTDPEPIVPPAATDVGTAPSDGMQTSPKMPIAPVSVAPDPTRAGTRVEQFVAPSPNELATADSATAPAKSGTQDEPASSVGSLSKTSLPGADQEEPVTQEEPPASASIPELPELEEDLPAPEKTDPPLSSIPELTPITQDELLAEPPVPSVPVTKATDTPSAAPAATTPKSGKYGIQVAAVPAGSDDKVAEVTKRHQAENPYALLSEDGKWLRIYIGRFENRSEALAKQEALRKIPEFKECFIRALN